ncbi:MAG: methyl-accepting chemotaxis protein [Candidatus Omnitrophota bacterium]
MKWFRDLSLAFKLNLAFFIMIVLIGVIGIEGYWSLKVRQRILNDVFTTRIPSLDYLIEVDRDLQQLLVAERSMIFCDAATDQFKQLAADYNDNYNQMEERWQKYKALCQNEEEQTLFPQFEKSRDEWKAISQQIVDGRSADTREGRRLALDLSLGIAQEKFEATRAYLDQLQQILLKISQTDHETANASYGRNVFDFFFIMVIGLIAGILLSYLINKGITNPLAKCMRMIQDLSAGKLNQSLDIDQKDEIGVIAGELAQMSASLREIIQGIQQSAEQVAASSEHLSTSSQSLAQGATEQASNLEEAAKTIDDLIRTIGNNSKNARQTEDVSSKAAVEADRGGQAVMETVDAMKTIADKITIINDISDQTNLLALNAAIEAARAGEMGKGFAVVAVEVRKLAERSQVAAKEIGEMAKSSVVKAEEAGALIQSVVPDIKNASELVRQISANCNEQTQSGEQLRTVIHQLEQVTRENSSSSEECASSSEELAAQAQSLQEMVSHFDIGETTMDKKRLLLS